MFSTTPRTSAISPLPLHDALPICSRKLRQRPADLDLHIIHAPPQDATPQIAQPPKQVDNPDDDNTDHRVFDIQNSGVRSRSEEHTSELQSLRHLVCRLLLEKKKKI